MEGKSKGPEWLELSPLLDVIGDGVLALDLDGVILYASGKAAEFLGLNEDVVGRAVADVVSADCRGAVSDALQQLARGNLQSIDSSFPSTDGKDRWARVLISPVTSTGQRVGALASLTDIADFKEAEVRQRTSRAQFDAVFENLPFECWVMERDGRFVMQNQQSIQRLGSVCPSSIDSVALPGDILSDWHTDFSIANDGHDARRDVTLSFKEGRKHFNRLLVPIRDGGDILGVLGVCVETTERRNLEEQLAQSQKLDAVGRLAGGIAHDFNNILTAIMSCVRLLERRLEGPPRRELQIIREGAQRASELTRQLLAFAKQEMTEPRRTPADDIVEKSDRLLRRLIGEDIDLVTIAEAEGWDVVVDPVRIEQAIINLVVNARDAMPRGGKIKVRCRGVELSSSRQAADGLITPGAYALISVEDSGVGMNDETKARAFEPFFTTRQELGGTGLGLSSVYGSVNQAQGHVTLESAVGKGTTVGLYLPRALGPALVKVTEPERPQSAVGGTETILLVEDEAIVMSVTCQTLRLGGYTVLEAHGPKAALDVSRAHEGTIDLLLTDVVMPHGTGPDLAATIKSERPQIAVLFVSGYATERRDLEVDEMSFLAKPFTPDRLDAQVRKVLDARQRF